MLLSLTRKICPLVSLFLTVACGKDASENQSGNFTVVTRQEPSPVLSLQLKGSKLKRYLLPLNANFILPDRLLTHGGDVAGQTVTITYNRDPEHNDYEFRCFYSGNQSQEMFLDRCVDHLDREFGPIAANKFPMDQDKEIRMQYSGTLQTELVIEALFQVQWK